MNEIKSLNIVDIISRYIDLKKSGKNYFGLCPFHGEKTPSFSVIPEKSMFKCFGCGVSGDAADFIQRLNNCSFQEALKHLGIKQGNYSEEAIERIKYEKQLVDSFKDWLIKADVVLSWACCNIDYIMHNYVKREKNIDRYGFLYHRQVKYDYWRWIITHGSEQEQYAFYKEHKYLSDIFDNKVNPVLLRSKYAECI